MSPTYKIIHVNGHYEVYIDDNFLCTADTIAEAEKEINNTK